MFVQQVIAPYNKKWYICDIYILCPGVPVIRKWSWTEKKKKKTKENKRKQKNKQTKKQKTKQKKQQQKNKKKNPVPQYKSKETKFDGLFEILIHSYFNFYKVIWYAEPVEIYKTTKRWKKQALIKYVYKRYTYESSTAFSFNTLLAHSEDNNLMILLFPQKTG